MFTQASKTLGGDRTITPCAILRTPTQQRQSKILRVRSRSLLSKRKSKVFQYGALERPLQSPILQRAVWVAAATVEDELESPVDDLEDASDTAEPSAQASRYQPCTEFSHMQYL